MARYPLSLPAELKREAEDWAASQGVSLNQFILWSVAEKVGALKQKQSLADPAFPGIAFRRRASNWPVPVVRGTGIRVQTLVIASQNWRMAPAAIAAEYELTMAQVEEALAFYRAHQDEIDVIVQSEQALEKSRG